MGKALFATTLLFAWVSRCPAQNFVRDLDGIPFYHDTVAYTEPLGGGLNAPMHQFADADGDGDLDLYIFDSDFYAERYFFRNTGDSSTPVYSLEPDGGLAGVEFTFWFRFIDYDGDASVDLLTDNGSSGVRVWGNDNPAGEPHWVVAVSELADTAGTALFAGFGGLPGFADLDGDGLPDFLSSNSADGSFNYYRNVGTAGSPSYALVSTRLSDITITSDTCTKGAVAPAAPDNPAHGLGAVALDDMDANGTADLFYGDVFSHSLFHLRNSGTPQDPVLECESNFFPPDGSLTTPGFNQAYFADLDADGDRDLTVGVLNSRTRHSFWYYENTGTPAVAHYDLVTTEYLATLDVGQNAKPAFADLDADLDLDLVIGTNDGDLWHFRNDGSILSPLYHLADTAFAGISGNFSYAPAFFDADADGDPDLLLGRFDGRVILYLNEGPGGFIPSDTIITAQYAVPAAGDVDGDGDPDLVVGRGNGTLSFYRNAGDSAHFDPVLETDLYLGADFGTNARPAFLFNAGTGFTDLYVAPASGDTSPGGRSRIWYYRNTGTSVEPPFVLGDDHFGPGVPYEPAIAFGDLEGDGDDDMLVGTSKGDSSITGTTAPRAWTRTPRARGHSGSTRIIPTRSTPRPSSRSNSRRPRGCASTSSTFTGGGPVASPTSAAAPGRTG